MVRKTHVPLVAKGLNKTERFDARVARVAHRYSEMQLSTLWYITYSISLLYQSPAIETCVIVSREDTQQKDRSNGDYFH